MPIILALVNPDCVAMSDLGPAKDSRDAETEKKFSSHSASSSGQEQHGNQYSVKEGNFTDLSAARTTSQQATDLSWRQVGTQIDSSGSKVRLFVTYSSLISKT
jgi:hypothetical protein